VRANSEWSYLEIRATAPHSSAIPMPRKYKYHRTLRGVSKDYYAEIRARIALAGVVRSRCSWRQNPAILLRLGAVKVSRVSRR
jgi:hypothetical protein